MLNKGKAKLLLEYTSVGLVLAGRNETKAEEIASRLNRQFGEDRARGHYSDAADPASLKAVMQPADLAIVASSTSQYTREIAVAALETGTDNLDIQYSSYKMAVLKGLEQDMITAGCCFITDGGFHPGLAAVLVHQAAASFDSLESANVGSVIKINWPSLNLSKATVQELVEELKDFNTSYFNQGRWKKGGMRKMNFGEPFGTSRCSAMMLEEMCSLPSRYPALKEIGSLHHEDGYKLTAIPVAACIRQYLDGSIRQPGLRMQANLVHGGRLLKDIETMGVVIKEKV